MIEQCQILIKITGFIQIPTLTLNSESGLGIGAFEKIPAKSDQLESLKPLPHMLFTVFMMNIATCIYKVLFHIPKLEEPHLESISYLAHDVQISATWIILSSFIKYIVKHNHTLSLHTRDI